MTEASISASTGIPRPIVRIIPIAIILLAAFAIGKKFGTGWGIGFAILVPVGIYVWVVSHAWKGG